MSKKLSIEELKSEIEKLWSNNKVTVTLDDWLNACKVGQEKFHKAKKQFHQWNPLKVYISVGKAKSSMPIFSLRFFGQEIAELIVKDANKVILRISKKHSARNDRYFKGCPLKQGDYLWNSEKAKELRRFFKDWASRYEQKPHLRSEEHRIESKFIEEMLNGQRKFGRSNLEIQPVTLASLPLQLPVPFSANTGEPKLKTGHIDILARRRGKDNKTRLSVWELKKPGAYGHAAYQSCIYAIQLLKILRSKNGKEWYRVFGFHRQVPKSLEIEAVVAITSDAKKQFDRDKNELGEIIINSDAVKLYAVYYEEKPDTIILDENSFCEAL